MLCIANTDSNSCSLIAGSNTSRWTAATNMGISRFPQVGSAGSCCRLIWCLPCVEEGRQ